MIQISDLSATTRESTISWQSPLPPTDDLITRNFLRFVSMPKAKVLELGLTRYRSCVAGVTRSATSTTLFAKTASTVRPPASVSPKAYDILSRGSGC
jgi:hypothetical protein